MKQNNNIPFLKNISLIIIYLCIAGIFLSIYLLFTLVYLWELLLVTSGIGMIFGVMVYTMNKRRTYEEEAVKDSAYLVFFVMVIVPLIFFLIFTFTRDDFFSIKISPPKGKNQIIDFGKQPEK